MKVNNTDILTEFASFISKIQFAIVVNFIAPNLCADWTMLQNRKFVGTLPEQAIRTSSKPLISEVSR